VPGRDHSEEAKAILKAELVRRGLTHAALAALLTQAGSPITETSLRGKLSRGGFSAAFFLQCLDLIGATDVRLR
jgi:hypothetical protein